MAYREVVLDYFNSLAVIRKVGLYRSLYKTWKPYIKATRGNFDPRKLTFIELGLSFGRLRKAPWRKR